MECSKALEMPNSLHKVYLVPDRYNPSISRGDVRKFLPVTRNNGSGQGVQQPECHIFPPRRS